MVPGVQPETEFNGSETLCLESDMEWMDTA